MVPGARPVTIPVLPTEAIEVVPLHTPPAIASDSRLYDPTVIVDDPVIVPADTPFTVTSAEALALPQPFVTV